MKEQRRRPGDASPGYRLFQREGAIPSGLVCFRGCHPVARRFIARRSTGLCTLIVLLLASVWMPILVEAQEPGGSRPSLYASPLERFGVNVAARYGAVTDYDVARLQLGWYLDYQYSATPARPQGVQYAQLVRVSEGDYPPDWVALAQAVDNNPGALWLIGNEPDTRGQDERLPEDYAMIYHDLRVFIKGRDPTAQLVAGNIVQPTPLRLEWLDKVWQTYQQLYGVPLVAEAWGLHNQILQEDRFGWGCGVPPGSGVDQGQLYTVWDNANLDIFRQHIVTFRTWMRDHGERDKPLLITEYGVLMPSEYLGGGDRAVGEQIVIDFMKGSFDHLLSATDEALGCPADGNRLVQRWAWYSLNDKLIDLDTFEGFNGALYDWRYSAYPGVLTRYGSEYIRYIASLAAKNPFLPLLLKGGG